MANRLSLQTQRKFIRSLSDNKDNLTPERNSFAKEILMRLQTIKEHAGNCSGTLNINTVDKK